MPPLKFHEDDMARFPENEADIYALALRMIYGLHYKGSVFPKPKVSWFALNTKAVIFRTRLEYAAAAVATVRTAQNNKQIAMETLVKAVKKNLAYAEMITNGDDVKLKLIGWGARSQPHSLIAPGQPRDLRYLQTDERKGKLVWEVPAGGGKVVAYEVLCRKAGQSKWQYFKTSLETQLDVYSKAGETIEYCVAADNKVGRGAFSNTVVIA